MTSEDHASAGALAALGEYRAAAADIGRELRLALDAAYAAHFSPARVANHQAFQRSLQGHTRPAPLPPEVTVHSPTRVEIRHAYSRHFLILEEGEWRIDGMDYPCGGCWGDGCEECDGRGWLETYRAT